MISAVAGSSGVWPSAAGTRRDIREQTDLARTVPFFGSIDAARRFAETGVGPIVSELPRRVIYADFGGGQGVLASAVRQFINSNRRECQATVLDANPNYLMQTAASGISAVCGNIEQSSLRNVDLATMRLVLHYNSRRQQAAVLGGIARSLVTDGAFVSQIETGDPMICALHTQISNLLSREDAAGYYWATLEEYCELLRDQGFCDIVVVCREDVTEIDVDAALADAWQRFNGAALRNALLASQFEAAEAMSRERDMFLHAANEIIEDASPQLRSFRLHYPIVTCRYGGGDAVAAQATQWSEPGRAPGWVGLQQVEGLRRGGGVSNDRGRNPGLRVLAAAAPAVGSGALRHTATPPRQGIDFG